MESNLGKSHIDTAFSYTNISFHMKRWETMLMPLEYAKKL